MDLWLVITIFSFLLLGSTTPFRLIYMVTGGCLASGKQFEIVSLLLEVMPGELDPLLLRMCSFHMYLTSWDKIY